MMKRYIWPRKQKLGTPDSASITDSARAPRTPAKPTSPGPQVATPLHSGASRWCLGGNDAKAGLQEASPAHPQLYKLHNLGSPFPNHASLTDCSSPASTCATSSPGSPTTPTTSLPPMKAATRPYGRCVRTIPRDQHVTDYFHFFSHIKSSTPSSSEDLIEAAATEFLHPERKLVPRTAQRPRLTRPLLLRAREKQSGISCVAKILCKASIPPTSGGETMWRKLCDKLLQFSEHPNILPFFAIVEDDNYYYIFTERLQGGELFDFLLSESAVPEELCKHLVRQILLALEYLHRQKIIHRDVKPENLMFRFKRPSSSLPQSAGALKVGSSSQLLASLPSLLDLYELVLIDFDTCRFQEDEHKAPCQSGNQALAAHAAGHSAAHPAGHPANHHAGQAVGRLAGLAAHTVCHTNRANCHGNAWHGSGCHSSACNAACQAEIQNGRRRLVGTYGYLAPEVLKGMDYSPASDLWSVGVVLYILMTGIPPVPMGIMKTAKQSHEALEKLEARGLDFNFSPLPEFPYARDLCMRLLEFSPQNRISSATEALKHPWLLSSAALSAKYFCASPLAPLVASHNNRTPPYGPHPSPAAESTTATISDDAQPMAYTTPMNTST